MLEAVAFKLTYSIAFLQVNISNNFLRHFQLISLSGDVPLAPEPRFHDKSSETM